MAPKIGVEPAPVPPSPTPAPQVPPPPQPTLIRVTGPEDGELLNRMYSYWSSSWIGPDGVYAFCGHGDGQPRFFRVNLETHGVERLGPLLGYAGTGEGWYWDRAGFIYLCDGPRLRRVNPFTGDDRVIFDISDDHPCCRLWQSHSSDDGDTHSATVQQITNDGPYLNIGTIVMWHGEPQYFPAHGALDESQITADGSYLIIKEDDGNRIITLGTRDTRILTNDAGAVGHSDCGEGFVVGEDDHHGACVLWDLRQPLTQANRRELFHTWGLGHLSVKGGRCLLSGSLWLSTVALDGSGTMPLIAHGMISDGTYDTQVFANLDPSGRVAAFMSNASGRLDLYLLEL